jgi:starch synthase
MAFSDCAEGRRFTRLGTRGPGRTPALFSHAEIIHNRSGGHAGTQKTPSCYNFVRMRVLMVGSEAAPFAKTGGLADVVGALPRALARLGHEVDVVMPRYRGITAGTADRTLKVSLGGLVADATCYVASHEGVRTIFIDHPGYFDRDYLYGAPDHDYPDNPERFAFLCQAALDWAVESGAHYDVVHAHDWQAGLVPVLLARMLASRTVLRRLPTVFTIHNLAYQGVFDASWLPHLGLGWSLMRMDAMEYWGRISYLKAGVVFSRLITTVSPRYAQEIQTPELGFGFDGILRERASDMVGILNGIDYDQWDPARDPNLPAPYSAADLTGKHRAKRALLERYQLPADEEALARPVVGIIARMVDQKGFDLLADIADELPRLGTIVLLGSGERRYEDLWLGLAARHPGQVGVQIGFDEPLAHLIEAGADLFLMPSQFEPCGLNQMYSLRYGTVPLVHETGGLADTVRNFDAATGAGTGFSFGEYSPQALLGTLRWALGVFTDRQVWARIQAAGMQQDFSWEASARRYVEVYERARTTRVWA